MSDTSKRALIDKANVTVVIVVSAAAFVTIFCLVAAKALWTQQSYQSRVISAREKARDQLKSDVTAADNLTNSYQQFVAQPVNVLSGNPSGSGPQDGDNARIVLDALPSKYDFPALATSLDKLVKGQNLTLVSITGTDDEAAQQKTSNSATPQPVQMPFSVSVKGSYQNIQGLIGVFEHSIRPFNIGKLGFKAEQGGDLTLNVDANTYYQPEKGFQFTSEVIK